MTAVQLGRLLAGSPPQYHACIEACLECIAASEACAGACLDDPAVRERVRCIRLSRDCAEACALAVRVMAGDEGRVAEVARMCARLADACAAECAPYADNPRFRACMDACRRCADACRDFTRYTERLAA